MLIVCNGMYRSGSTLQHNLVLALLEDKDVVNLGFMNAEALDENADELTQKALDPGYFVLKTHSALPEMTGDIRIVYSHRDLRDVATSIYSKMKCNQSKMHDMIADGVHVHQNLKLYPDAMVLVQSYDQLTRDPVACAMALATFIGCPTELEDARALAVRFDLDAIVNVQPKFRGLREAILSLNKRLGLGQLVRRIGLPASVTQWARKKVMASGDGSAFHFNHISAHKGKSGVWRDSLPAEDVDHLTQKYAEWLSEMGYATDVQTSSVPK